MLDDSNMMVDGIYLSSASESNFLGFLGQHSQICTPWIFGVIFDFEWPILSDIFREVTRGLVSDKVRAWLDREMDPLGLGLRDREVIYGDSLPSVGTGESTPGDVRP